MHKLSEHLDKPGTYARVLFIDFSSAFNTMRPSNLYSKLQDMEVDIPTCNWIWDYLHGRSQQVKVNTTLSSPIITQIGAPQGCVLSPVLFTIFTNNHRSSSPTSILIKYADDAAKVALLTCEEDEDEYHASVASLVAQCDGDELELNVKKTKELVVNFMKNKTAIKPITIKGTEVDQVVQYDYLGTTVANDMTWKANVQRLTNKGIKRVYGLRKLREFKVCMNLQVGFYHSIIESVVVFGIIVWGGAITFHDKNAINRIKRCAERIIGTRLPSWEEQYLNRVSQSLSKIMGDDKHPLHQYIEYLPSGKRLRQLHARTARFSKSFIPRAISLMNTGKLSL